MSQFAIEIIRRFQPRGIMVTARCVYVGRNSEFTDLITQKSTRWPTFNKNVDAEVARVVIHFSAQETKYEGVFNDGSETGIRVEDSYNAYIGQVYNLLHTFKLQEQYPFITNKLKGIGHALILCCLCEALRLDVVTPSSKIMLEATGGILGPEDNDELKGMQRLVAYYEKLGFRQAFPDFYEIGVRTKYVPMKATIGDIVERCAFPSVSQDLMKVLPVMACKKYCTQM